MYRYQVKLWNLAWHLGSLAFHSGQCYCCCKSRYTEYSVFSFSITRTTRLWPMKNFCLSSLWEQANRTMFSIIVAFLSSSSCMLLLSWSTDRPVDRDLDADAPSSISEVLLRLQQRRSSWYLPWQRRTTVGSGSRQLSAQGSGDVNKC